MSMKKRFNSRYTLRQGDIVLIDYGRNDTKSRISGKHPSVVVGNDCANGERMINVVPLFRKASRDIKAEDILLAPKDCKGLRYEEYLQPKQVQLVSKSRITRRIGCISNRKMLISVSVINGKVSVVQNLSDLYRMLLFLVSS